MNYGLPYMGSKSGIAQWVVQSLPAGDVLVDLFAGGCAVTHAAMLSRKYDRIIFNDVLGDVTQLFLDAVNGKYDNESRWISRDDFFRLKDTDPYVRLCWSFGNNQRDYLYSKEIEPYKRALHYAVMEDDWTECKELFPDTWEAAYNALRSINDPKERRKRLKTTIVGGVSIPTSNTFRTERGLHNSRLQHMEREEQIASLSKKKTARDAALGTIMQASILEHRQRAERLRICGGGGENQSLTKIEPKLRASGYSTRRSRLLRPSLCRNADLSRRFQSRRLLLMASHKAVPCICQRIQYAI